MKAKFGLFGLPLLFTGCLNLNLKQVLPVVKDYDLSVGAIEAQVCKDNFSVGLLEVLSADLYNTKSIVRRTAGGQIIYSKGQRFADLPTKMLKNMLLLQAPKHCVSVSLTPYAETSATLQLNILTFALLDNKAEIVLDYALNEGTKSKHGRIIQRQQTGQEELSQIQALQSVALKAISQLLEQIKPLKE
ncbi:ABC_trans_aux domain-containing protein [Helicobacter sp. NHP21005]|uniref:ABC-type transport auxiliary lipoprotein family protein n=1 Tax=Helicobacter felistomachi TaxID=3040201 RepID=UPI0025729F5F|nr:ABC-type transport auxiliary lipoprotein family protein [Helicobacter sp. NHP21005]BEG56701.1 ABC_trans_aux domain-containing protein [Helicobacter sp. NHP21005]